MALALGLPLSAVLSMAAAEVEFWHLFRERYGFPVDRLEAAAALGSAYVGGTWGGTAKPADLVFRPKAVYTREAIRAGFDALTPERFKGPNV